MERRKPAPMSRRHPPNRLSGPHCGAARRGAVHPRCHYAASPEISFTPSRGDHRSRRVHRQAVPEKTSSNSSQTPSVRVIKRPSELPMLFIYDVVYPRHQDGVIATSSHLAEVLLPLVYFSRGHPRHRGAAPLIFNPPETEAAFLHSTGYAFFLALFQSSPLPEPHPSSPSSTLLPGTPANLGTITVAPFVHGEINRRADHEPSRCHLLRPSSPNFLLNLCFYYTEEPSPHGRC
ncbi:hypothetical protein E2562_039342 [Oryza meyeriana var. granulata]|uniref:Uncharacterized protein n=1 Tax=Oryza meyeriana var. granulata TaxID=110450 RepID=A0A6G1EUM7_9ORYZ|nr:hypothetical protein E2562_039342 [Oryza meyeriana var. granulata]